MIQVFSLVLVCLLALGSGWRLTRHLALGSLLGRCLMTFTFAAAQWLLAIQLLSLTRQLTAGGFLLANGLLTLAVFLIFQRKGPVRTGISLGDVGCFLEAVRRHRVEAAMVAMAAAAVLVACGTGWAMFPMETDIYHFTMPLFWKQHATILPFLSFDARLIGVVFASEGLGFPGYLYMGSPVMFCLLSAVVAGFVVWTVSGLALQVGAPRLAAVLAGVMVVGFGPFFSSCLGFRTDMLLAALWFGASIYFLLESRAALQNKPDARLLFCSVFCLLMSCGAKNVVVLQGPPYLICLGLIHGRRLWSRPVLAALSVAGVTGMLASGVVWSYASNQYWFGTWKGGQELQGTVSTDFSPRSVWTRLCRGGVTLLYDVVWVPVRWRETYAQVCQRSVQVLGGKRRLAEDDEFFSFEQDKIRPGLGLGLLGFSVFAPGLMAGFAFWFRARRKRDPEALGASNCGILILLTIGSFIFYYAALRWQSIGLTRLMLAVVIVGAPLAAMLLRWRWFRVAACGVLFVSLAIYTTYGFGLALRRAGIPNPGWLAAKIMSLQRDHSQEIEYQWEGETPGILLVREGYTYREIYQLFFSRLTGPATVGYASPFWGEGYYAFGNGLSNKVVSLSDSRQPERIVVPPPEVDYLMVAGYGEIPPIDASVLQGFQRLFQASSGGKPIFIVFSRRPSGRL